MRSCLPRPSGPPLSPPAAAPLEPERGHDKPAGTNTLQQSETQLFLVSNTQTHACLVSYWDAVWTNCTEFQTNYLSLPLCVCVTDGLSMSLCVCVSQQGVGGSWHPDIQGY